MFSLRLPSQRLLAGSRAHTVEKTLYVYHKYNCPCTIKTRIWERFCHDLGGKVFGSQNPALVLPKFTLGSKIPGILPRFSRKQHYTAKWLARFTTGVLVSENFSSARLMGGISARFMSPRITFQASHLKWK